MDRIKQKTHSFLRKSEKYFKTDMVYLAKGGFWLFSNYGVLSALALLLSVFFARLLPQETYGVYRYVLSISAIIGALSLTGMNTAVTQAVARGFSKTLITSFLVQLKWSVVPVMVSIFVAIYYILNGNATIAIAVIITGLLIPISNSANTYMAFLNGRKDFRGLFFTGSWKGVFYTLAMILVLLITKNVIYIVLVYALSTTICNLFLYWRTARAISQDAPNDISAIKYGKHLSYMNVIGIIANQIDSILIFHYLGGAQLAIYSFATLIPEKIQGLFKFFSVVALPKFAEKEGLQMHLSQQKSVIHKTKLVALGAVGMTIVYILIAPSLYHLLFPAYTNSVIYSQVYSLSFLATAATTIIFTSLLATRAQKLLYQYNSISPIIQIIILGIMIYFYGLWGAIVARIISYTFNLFILLTPKFLQHHE